MGEKADLIIEKLISNILLQPNTHTHKRKNLYPLPSMILAELHREWFFHSIRLIHDRRGSIPVLLQSGLGRAGGMGNWPSIFCLAKAGGAPIPPSGMISRLTMEPSSHSHSGNQTMGAAAAALSLGGCQWNKGRAEHPPGPFATGQWEAMLHFCQSGFGMDQRKSTHSTAHVLNLNRGLSATRK